MNMVLHLIPRYANTLPKLFMPFYMARAVNEIDRWFDGTPHHQRRRYEGLVPIIQWRMEHSDNDYYNEFVEELPCPRCHGRRLSDAALSVTVGGIDIETYTRKSASEALRFISELQLSESDWKIARDIVKGVKRGGCLKTSDLSDIVAARRNSLRW